MSGIKDRVAVIGMGCSKFGERWDSSSSDLIIEAAYEAFEDAGIEARAFGTVQGGLGFPLGNNSQGWGTPVQVRSSDLDQARLVLEQARQDSIDIDWDTVDLGTFEGTAGAPSHGMPLAARIAFVATVLAVVLLLVTAFFTLLD